MTTLLFTWTPSWPNRLYQLLPSAARWPGLSCVLAKHDQACTRGLIMPVQLPVDIHLGRRVCTSRTLRLPGILCLHCRGCRLWKAPWGRVDPWRRSEMISLYLGRWSGRLLVEWSVRPCEVNWIMTYYRWAQQDHKYRAFLEGRVFVGLFAWPCLLDCPRKCSSYLMEDVRQDLKLCWWCKEKVVLRKMQSRRLFILRLLDAYIGYRTEGIHRRIMETWYEANHKSQCSVPHGTTS